MPPTCRIVKGTLLLALPALFYATTSLADSADPEFTIDDVANAWEARAKQVQTLRFKWHDKYRLTRGQIHDAAKDAFDPSNPENRTVPEKATTYEPLMSVVIDGDNIRYELKDLTLNLEQKLVPQETIWVWTHDEYRHLQKAGAVEYPRGHVSKSIYATWHPGDNPYLAPLLMTYRPFHPSLRLFENFRKRFRPIAGTRVVNGLRCVVLKEIRSSHIVHFLFLDPERNFLLMKSTWEVEGVEKGRLEFLEYRQENENWIPVRWISPQQIIGTISGCHVDDFTLNSPIDSKEFELEFPAGTHLAETANPQRYLVDDQGKRQPAIKKRISTEQALADHRMLQFGNMKGRNLWGFTVLRQDDFEVRVEPADAENPEQPLRLVVNDSSCDQLLFGKGHTQVSARTRLVARIRQDIQAIDKICKLTKDQQKKLELAGRRDTDRLFEQAAAFREKLKRLYDEDDVKKGLLDPTIVELSNDTAPLRHAVTSESFEGESFFAKTLNAVLTDEQAAQYKKRRE